jgi:hypothetical protein
MPRHVARWVLPAVFLPLATFAFAQSECGPMECGLSGADPRNVNDGQLVLPSDELMDGSGGAGFDLHGGAVLPELERGGGGEFGPENSAGFPDMDPLTPQPEHLGLPR